MRGRPRGITKKKMWTIMRKLGHFTADEVSTITGIKIHYVRSYICKLLKAGYLRVEGRSEAPFKPKIYRLVRDTGIEAPVDCSVIYDPNLGKIVMSEKILQKERNKDFIEGGGQKCQSQNSQMN